MNKTFSFSEADLERIAAVLGVSPKKKDHTFRFELADENSGRHITLEIVTELNGPAELAQNLLSVYAASSFLQLHDCTGFIASQELGEVIFFGRQGNIINGLVIERQAACSMYANVDPKLLSADFTQLPPEMIMSSVSLSMAESIFDDLG